MFYMVLYNWGTKELLPTDHPLHSANYAAFAKELRHIGEECGITCNQSHAPIPVYNAGIRSYLKRSIECTAIAGGRAACGSIRRYVNKT